MALSGAPISKLRTSKQHLHSSNSLLWRCLFSSTSSRPNDPPEPIPNRPLRSSPEPIPNRPPRSSPQPIPNGPPRSSRNQNQTPPPNPNSDPRYQSLSNEDFLDKFKMGLKKNDDSDSATTSNIGRDRENNDCGPPPDADELFRKMKETGLIPNAVAMLDGLCKDGLVQEAMKLFGLMREKGTIPDVVIYTAVVEAFCKAHKFDDAKRIFRKMIDDGIVPNAFTYTVLVQGFYNCNYLDDALDFCLKMLDAGHSPNVATFVGLIDAFCRTKGVDEARSVVTKLQRNGFFLNDKAIRNFLDKKGAISSLVPEAVFGKTVSKSPFGRGFPPVS